MNNNRTVQVSFTVPLEDVRYYTMLTDVLGNRVGPPLYDHDTASAAGLFLDLLSDGLEDIVASSLEGDGDALLTRAGKVFLDYARTEGVFKTLSTEYQRSHMVRSVFDIVPREAETEAE